MIISQTCTETIPSCFHHDAFRYQNIYLMRCAICYHLYNLKNVKNTHEGVFLLVRYILSFFKLYKRYQIAQRITYADTGLGTRDKD